MWEDDVLYRGDRAGWSADYLSHAGWLINTSATARPIARGSRTCRSRPFAGRPAAHLRARLISREFTDEHDLDSPALHP